MNKIFLYFASVLLSSLILTVIGEPERICVLYRYYCGIQVSRNHSTHEWSLRTEHNRTLYQCDGAGDSFGLRRICDEGCKAIDNGNSYCLCVPNKRYCGHELNGFWNHENFYENHSLYICDQFGLNVSRTQACDGACEFALQSYCRGTCSANYFYCGSNLKELGWEASSLDDDTLYLCESDGMNIRKWTECSHGKCDSSYCKCQPATYYCGRELYTDLGWKSARRNSNELYRCTSNGSWVAKINSNISCSTCVPKHAHNPCVCDPDKSCNWQCQPMTMNTSWCKCEHGRRYCGRELTQLGWSGYEKRTIYECFDGNNVKTVRACETDCILGSSRQPTCDRYCIENGTYCGDKLRELGWQEHYDNDTVYRCNPGGRNVTFVTQCKPGACDANNCRCEPRQYYCGRELLEQLAWTGLASTLDDLYQCTDSFGLNDIFQCESCGSSQTTTSRCKCVPSENYCGYELHELGWNDEFDNNTIYRCESGGMNVSIQASCTGGMCKESQCLCQLGEYYCGHELSERLGWTTDTNQFNSLFECTSNGATAAARSNALECPRCNGRNVTGINSSWCECKVGAGYCGYQLSALGWRNFDDRRIYECIAGDKVKETLVCPSNCTFLPTDNRVICANMCLPGAAYCGSKLERMGYRGYSERAVYHCIGQNAALVDSGKTHALCTEQCVAGRHYCGRVVQYARFTTGVEAELRYLYKCRTDGGFEYISACGGSCIDDDETGAYCSVPWYVYFGALTAGLLFILLGSLFLYFCLKHRRLKNTTRAHRIDANQLQSIAVLDRGEFGEVWRAIYKPHEGDSIDVALKLSNEKTDLDSKLACANCFLQEVVALNILIHPNIVRAFGVCTNYKDRSGHTIPALVLEYMNGGNAIAYLRSTTSRSLGRDLLRIFTDVARAGDHLRKMGIIHRDIAARNVLVENNNDRVKVAKLTDFGLAKDIGKGSSMYKSVNNAIVHCRYASPEAITGCFSTKSDVWSFGVLMWEVFAVLEEESMTEEDAHRPAISSRSAGPLPYGHIHSASELFEQVRAGLRLEQPRMAPDPSYKKMLECWAHTPESRPSFEELVAYFGSKQSDNIHQLLAHSASWICDSDRTRTTVASEEIEMRSRLHGRYTGVETSEAQPDGYSSALHD